MTAILRNLRYPFASDITKTQLYSVGSMHTWPSILAMLTWMVELILCTDQINVDEYEESELQENSEQMFYDYLVKAYPYFLEGDDAFEPVVQELKGTFEQRNVAITSRIDELVRQNEQLVAEFEALSATEPPLAVLERERETYLNDLEKFRKYIKHLEVKREKLEQSISRMEDDSKTLGELASTCGHLKRENFQMILRVD